MIVEMQDFQKFVLYKLIMALRFNPATELITLHLHPPSGPRVIPLSRVLTI